MARAERSGDPDHPAAYRAVLAVGTPLMTRWSRLSVTGLECLPRTGPVVLAADHDSYWDPIAIAVAARHVRPVRALSKSTLWKNPLVARFMDGMGHIPVIRGVSNDEAMARAVAELRAGACIGMFPEGTRSLGRELRARAGVGRLAEAVPEATTVCVRVNGSTEVVRLPTRPRVTVEFFLPRAGQWRTGEPAAEFSERLLAELREGAPRETPGRRRRARRRRSVTPS
ncbi:lysophospholipid acyltransferase family protein [Jatrophihabitans fulvus]